MGARKDLRILRDDVQPELVVEGGPTLTLAMADDDAAAEWLLSVYVHLGVERHAVARLRTTAPSALGARHQSRVIALACCPGASSWDVIVVRTSTSAAKTGRLVGVTSDQVAAQQGNIITPIFPYASFEL